MLRRGLDFIAWTRPWRDQYGQVAGMRLALALRRAFWAGKAGATVPIHVPTLMHPVHLRAGTSDAKVFVQVFGTQHGDFPVSGQPAVIVDAGANIGLTAVAFANRFPSAKILAMEIDRHNYAMLCANCRPYANIQPVLGGLWSRASTLRVSNPADESWSFQPVEGDRTEGSVEGLGIPDVLRAFEFRRIDILKIDIEGGEYEVFRHGVDDWIERVGVILVETHDRFRPGCTDVIRRALAGHPVEESTWFEYLVFRRVEAT